MEKNMKTKSKSYVLFLLSTILLSGCQQKTAVSVTQPTNSTPVSDTVNLTVWGAEEDEELLRQIFSEFEEEYRGQADFVINYQPQSESH